MNFTPTPIDPAPSQDPRRPPWHGFEHVLARLGWSGLGGVLGSGFLFLVNVLAGRWLGPSQFGSVQYCISIAQVMLVAATLGLDVSANRALPRTRDEEARRSFISTTACALVTSFVLLATAAFLLRGPLSKALAVDERLVMISVAFAIAYGLRNAADRMLSGLEQFRFQSMVRPLEGVIALVVLAAFQLFGDVDDYRVVILALGAGAITLLCGALGRLVAYLSLRAASRDRFRELAQYGRLALLHTITPLGLALGDKVAIQRELGPSSMGVYAAYFTISILVVTQVLAIVSNVLFPIAARSTDKHLLMARLRRVQLTAFLPMLVGMSVIVTLLLRLYGADYEFRLEWVLLSSSWAALLFANGLTTVVTVTHSIRSFRATVLFQGARSLIFIAGLIVLSSTDTLSLTSVFVSLVVMEILDTLNLRRIIGAHVLR